MEPNSQLQVIKTTFLFFNCRKYTVYPGILVKNDAKKPKI